ncbi:glycosyltransferase [Leucobacter viscericola]|uniref:Glycosyltransferase n=1 Tax=Leucobacter viscericola TaxID=2714935 RepID=A0A6G7XEP8_9MICO|nr:CDP-glycerol glycerophosphotransferase family protein [Leucobacter viscericola]QIK63023.1 glycosyltransferase [Leucobacter viscericola]
MTAGQPRFSVVMSIYNQEPWMDQAIESIISQDLGFEEHIELILVNDGSVDGSLRKCEIFREKYPNNVVVIDQANQGLSAARNAGMAAATGQLVNFFDPDDFLAPNVFSEVWDFWQRHSSEGLPFITIPLELTGAKNGRHGKYEFFPEKNAVIDLLEEPGNFVLSSAASFYPRENIEGAKFDSSMLSAEDSLFNFELLARFGPRFGYVCEQGVQYEYTQHVAGANQVARSVRTASGFQSAVTLLSRLLPPVGEEAPRYLKELIIYELRQRIGRMRRKYFESDEEYEALVASYREFIDYLDPETLKTSPWVTSMVRHFMFSSAMTRDQPWQLGADGMVFDRENELFHLDTIPVQVRRINKRPEAAEIEAVFFNYFISGFDLVMVSDTGDVLEASGGFSGKNEFSKRDGEFIATETQYRKFLLPAPSRESRWRFAFRLTATGELHFVADVKQWGESPFRGYDPTRKSISETYWMRFLPESNEFWINRAHTKVGLYNLRSTLRLLWKEKRFVPVRLFSKPQKRTILITDRPGFGDDNGEALFRYVQESRPDLKNDTWLVLAKTAPGYNELKRTKRIVKPGSFRHRLLFVNCRILLTSHLSPTLMSPWGKRVHAEIADLFDRTLVWLQHGVTMNDVGSTFNRLPLSIDAVVVGTAHEEHFALREGLLYDEETVLGTGFSRFDLLEDQSAGSKKRSILYAPTWRTWLTGRIMPDGSHEVIDDFEESLYFQQQRQLLSDPEILEALRAADASIDMLLHPGMAAYVDNYNALVSDRVRVHRPGSVKYRDALNSSVAMITDYSSVFFDFAYMGKPVILDHSDQEEFRTHHYGEGVFDYASSAPGAVVDDFIELKREILAMIDGGFKMEEKYLSRLDGVFLHRDQKNSQRVIEAALNVDQRRRGLLV